MVNHSVHAYCLEKGMEGFGSLNDPGRRLCIAQEEFLRLYKGLGNRQWLDSIPQHIGDEVYEDLRAPTAEELQKRVCKTFFVKKV